MARELDLVLMGATGFTGRLVADHLAARAGEARVGLAGRSADRLRAVRDDIARRHPAAAAWEICAVDSADRPGLDRLAARTPVIGSTVGPFMQHGLPLVEACAGAGTHYADITGEANFVRASVDRCHDRARATGARIVHACGYDSIPSDLGMQFLHEQAGEPMSEAILITGRTRGGFSGGTLASAAGLIAAAQSDRATRRLLADPYNLSPARDQEAGPARQPDMAWAARDPLSGRRVGPFFMAPFNTRIVRRTNALLGWAYGKELRYRETFGLPGGISGWLTGHAFSAAMLAGGAALAWGPTRRMILSRLPPGTGPSAEERARGFFAVSLYGRTLSGRTVSVRVSGEGDPGYDATSRMLGEAILALSAAPQGPGEPGGVLTPATALGAGLRARLLGQRFRFEAGAGA